MRITLSLATCLVLLSPSALANTCSSTSGPQRIPVVELFTSEGCSSCPPADRWLSGLIRPPSVRASFTALAYHVDYWDHIGWKDRFAAPEHGQRHAALVARAGTKIRYTPQVFVNGEESQMWRHDGQLPVGDAAGAKVDAMTRANGEGGWHVAVRGSTRAKQPLLITLALVESGLTSTVTSGENRGESLSHDFVVRNVQDFELAGPTISLDATMHLPPDADAKRSLAAIVVRTRAGESLQSLSVPLCE